MNNLGISFVELEEQLTKLDINWDEISNNSESETPPPPQQTSQLASVILNVGGVERNVSRATLIKSPVFETVFDVYDQTNDERNSNTVEFFLDRDVMLFDEICLYLAWNIAPANLRVLAEMEHYGICIGDEPSEEQLERVNTLGGLFAKQIIRATFPGIEVENDDDEDDDLAQPDDWHKPFYLSVCGSVSCTSRWRLCKHLPYFDAELSGRFKLKQSGTREDPYTVDVPEPIWRRVLQFIREPHAPPSVQQALLDNTTVKVLQLFGCESVHFSDRGLADVYHACIDANTLPDRPLDKSNEQVLKELEPGRAGGGLMQLVATNAQDLYLSGQPQMTFWKESYKRHTNYAAERVCLELVGQPKSEAFSAVITRQGDLVSQAYLRLHFSIDGEFRSYKEFETQISLCCYRLVSRLHLEIGGHIVDQMDGYQIWLMSKLDPNSIQTRIENDGSGTLQMPFFFTMSSGKALPLIGLQYHEVRIFVELNRKAAGIPEQVAIKPELLLTYVFLDSDERRTFAQQAHEVLIPCLHRTQVFSANGVYMDAPKLKAEPMGGGIRGVTMHQEEGPVNRVVVSTEPGLFTCRLDGNHPTKVLYFTLHADDSWEQAFNPLDELISYTLQLNNHDRERGDRHTAGVLNKVDHGLHYDAKIPVYVIAFAKNPMDRTQPSGSCNFSRIDVTKLIVRASAKVKCVRVWGDYWNVFRVMSGMAGLAYAT